MQAHDFTEEINGVCYFTVKRFAEVTCRSEQNVRFLMAYGNRIRKLRVMRLGGKPYIPYSEYTDFPFTLPGRGSHVVYHYHENGTVVEVQNAV